MRNSRHKVWRGARRWAGGREGLTVIEVLMALGVFLVGSVSIVGLFVTASVLHADAVARRTVSFIAEELLAEVQAMKPRDYLARTNLSAVLGNGAGDTTAYVDATEADRNYKEAGFSRWPLPEDQTLDRQLGPLLIGAEWIWYTARHDLDFDGLLRNRWGTVLPASEYSAGARVVQPRMWFYVLESPLDSLASAPSVVSITVNGNPGGDPTDAPPFEAPARGYIVIDREWIAYESRGWESGAGTGSFSWNTSADHRVLADSDDGEHKAGTPVTVAREHPRYPGFYYTLQFYPVSSTTAECKVIASVAYGTERQLRRAFFFETVKF